jgi:glycolate oxidase FAD binding subunit
MLPDSPVRPEDFVPATQSELSRFVAENFAGAQQALYPVGGRTALNYGYPARAAGITVSTSRLVDIIDYPARDMTVTVEAGLRMDELAAILKNERQQLPIDVPQSNRATLGGIVATNTSGPRRFGYGTLRDYLIGISAVDARGRLFRAGGRVVKNVAGYDLCKLLVGSLGTLAVLTQMTLKLKPLPESTAIVWASFKTLAQIDCTLEQMLTSATRPVALEVLNPQAAKQITAESRQDLPAVRPVLVVSIEGSQRETRWQIEALKQELSSPAPQQIEVVYDKQATQLLEALTEYQAYSDDPLTFQANLLPSKTLEFIENATQMGASVQAHAGNGIVIGHLPDDVVTVEKAAELLTPLRSFARQHRGNLVIFNCETQWKQHLPVFGEPESSHRLMQRLKSTLDPQNLLNPGRFFNGAG